MKKHLLIAFLLFALVLAGCSDQPEQIAELTQPTETTTLQDVPAETTAPIPEETESEEPFISPLQPGFYLISSVGIDGNVSFYATMDPENGYLLLKEDGTGTMLFDGVEAELTWTEDSVIWDSRELVGLCSSYFDPELDRMDTILILYFTDTPTSLIFRICPAPEN